MDYKKWEIFENRRPSFNSWKTIYYQELKLVGYRIKRKYEAAGFKS
jgi:hypothetical protein